MIKLFGFVPLWGLPDPSPYVTKTETLFKMADIPYEKIMANLDSVSKHKAPYIENETGEIIQDSTFIRKYLESQGADFNGNYSAKDLAAGYAMERLCENHLNWILTYYRWLDEDNFNKGPRVFFMNAPEEMREKIIESVRAEVKSNHHGHGISRHSPEEVFELAKLDLEVISDFLGDNNFLLGDEPCGYDASVHATLMGLGTPHFDSQAGEYLRNHKKLSAYIKRMSEFYYPEFFTK
jgi:glutathione S-transferase